MAKRIILYLFTALLAVIAFVQNELSDSFGNRWVFIIVPIAIFVFEWLLIRYIDWVRTTKQTARAVFISRILIYAPLTTAFIALFSESDRFTQFYGTLFYAIPLITLTIAADYAFTRYMRTRKKR